MATIKEDFIQHLLDQSAITDLTGTSRIRPNRFPQEETGDRIVVEQTSADPEHHMRGAQALHTTIFDVHCFSAMFLGVSALADAVRLAVDGFQGTMNSSATVSLVRLLDIRDSPVLPQSGGEKGTPQITLRFEIKHTVAVGAFF